jgi:hypothetical protein
VRFRNFLNRARIDRDEDQDDYISILRFSGLLFGHFSLVVFFGEMSGVEYDAHDEQRDDGPYMYITHDRFSFCFLPLV